MPNRLITIAEMYKTIPAVSVPDTCEADVSFGTALNAVEKAAMVLDRAMRCPKTVRFREFYNVKPRSGR